MTTTSAGDGASADENGGSGEWSWFSPAQRTSDGGQRGREQEAEQIPSRPVTPIRPVGSGAQRARTGQGAAPPAAARPQPPGNRPGAVPDGAIPDGPIPDDVARGAAPGAGYGAGQGRVPAQGSEPEPEHRSPERPAAAARPEYEASPDAVLIRRTLEEVEPFADSVTAYFYAILFVQHPQLRDLFPASMDVQRDRLFRALLTAAKLIDDPDILVEYLAGLGRGHRKYGTRSEHYPAVGESLIATLSQYAPQTWGEEAEAAWVRAYTSISQVMIDAAAADEMRAPAWWNAEVVAHEMRTSDIAVVTVRPDSPYPFRAGQYSSVETPWWPRVWRHYSFAGAPRSDGLLTFHVKSVPAGWVSGALVHRARPGDVIRLGPPSGAMTVDHSSDSGLLCLGGGTGIAPIKAMVEDVAEHGRPRPVEVFYGARSDHDLYDLETMFRLEQQHPWLAVRPVVSDAGRPAGPGGEASLTGELPDVVRRYGPWASYDGYLSGPPGMIRSGVDALVGSGIPSHRIRHDSLDELAVAGDH